MTGEKIVLQLFNETATRSLVELGLAAPLTAERERFLGRVSGSLFLTGPAGSGKTTAIHACLRQLPAAGSRHVIKSGLINRSCCEMF